MTIVSLPHLAMLEASPPEMIRAAASAGFDAVGLRIRPTMAGEAPHPLRPGTRMHKECLALLSETGVKLLDIEAFWLRPETDPRDFLADMETASALGAESLQFACADPDLARAKSNLAHAAELAQDFGLRIEFEYMAVSAVASLRAALEMVAGCGTGNVGIMLDMLHIARCATTLDELRSIPSSLINIFQICDAPAAAPDGFDAAMQEARFGRLLPGEGTLRLFDVTPLLPAATKISVEVPLVASRGLAASERANILMQAYRRYRDGGAKHAAPNS